MTVELSSLKVSAELDAQAYVAGANAKVAADQKMIDSDGKVQASVTQTERRLTQAGGSAERLARSLDPAYSNQQKFAAGSATLQRALDAGTISADRHAQLLEMLGRRYAPMVQGGAAAAATVATLASAARSTGQDLERFAESHNRVNNMSGKMREGLVLVHEMLSGNYRRAVGSAAIELQNFGLMQTIVHAAMNPFVLAATAAVGVFALLEYHYEQNASQLRQLDAALKTTGNTSMTTAANLQNVIKQLRDTGSSSSDANAAVLSVVRNPLVNPQLAGQITNIARDMTAGTGEKLPDMAKKLTDAFAGGYEGLKKFDDQFHVFTASELQSMRVMAEHGNVVGVLNTALDAFGRHAGNFNKSQSDLAKSSDTLSSSWNKMLDALSNTSAFKAVHDELIGAFNAVENMVKTVGSAWELAKSIGQWADRPGGNTPPPSSSNYQYGPTPGHASPYRGNPANRAAPGTYLMPGGALNGADRMGYGSGLGSALASRLSDPNGGLRGVDQDVIDWLTAASNTLPAGQRVEISAGRYNHSLRTYQGGLSEHGMGRAVDAYIVDQYGKRIPYPLHAGPGTPEYAAYQALGDAYISASGGRGRWGGYFTDPDIMHFGTIAPGFPAGARAPAYGSGLTRYAATAGTENSAATQAAKPTDQTNAAIDTQKKTVDELTESKQKAIAADKLWAQQQVIAKANIEADTFITSKNLVGKEAEAARTQIVTAALSQYNTQLAKESQLTDLRIKGLTDTAAGYQKSEVAGIQAAAMAQAQTEALQKGVNVTERYNQILREQAGTAIEAAAKSNAAMTPQIAAQERLATASAQSTAALHEAEVQNSAIAATQEAYNKALATGNEALIATAKAELDAATGAAKRLDVLKQITAVNEEINQRKDQGDITRLQISLAGRTPDQINAAEATLKEAQHLRDIGLLGTPKGDEALASVDAANKLNIQLAETTRAQQRIDDGFKQIGESIDRDLTKRIEDAFNGQKAQKWGDTVKQVLASLLSQAASNFLIKPLFGSILSGLGLDNAASGFGTLGSLFGLGGSSSSGMISLKQNSDGTLSLSNIGSGLSKVGGLFGNNGIFSAGGLFGSQGALFGDVADASIAAGGAPLSIGSSLASDAGGLFSSIGGFASAAFPVAGAVLGGVGLLGSLFGGLFGGKKKYVDHSSTDIIDLATGKINMTHEGSPQNQSNASQLAKSVAEFSRQFMRSVPGSSFDENVIVGSSDTRGIIAQVGGNSTKQYSDASQALDDLKVQVAASAKGISQTLKTAIANVVDSQELDQAVQFSKDYDNLRRTTDSFFSGLAGDTQKIGPYENALFNLNEKYTDLTTQAKEFGLSVDSLNDSLATATKRLKDDFTASVKDASLAATDSVAEQVAQQKINYDQQVSDAKALGLSLDDVNQANADTLTKIWKDTTQSLSDLKDSITGGSLSGLSSAKQASAAYDTYTKYLDLVEGGNLSYSDKLSSAASTLVGDYQSAYGNSPTTSKIRKQVLSDLDTVLNSRSFASGTDSTPPGWIRVGEGGPEWVFQPGGATVLPNGKNPPSGSSSEIVSALRDVQKLLRAGNMIAGAHGAITDKGFKTLTAATTKPSLQEPARVKA